MMICLKILDYTKFTVSDMLADTFIGTFLCIIWVMVVVATICVSVIDYKRRDLTKENIFAIIVIIVLGIPFAIILILFVINRKPKWRLK